MDLPSIEQRAKKPLDRGHLAASVSMTSGARINPLRGAVVIGALGVVFGDIRTSPIYTFRECLKAAGDAGNETVLGLLSLVFWALMLVVTIKYVCVVMRAPLRCIDPAPKCLLFVVIPCRFGRES